MTVEYNVGSGQEFSTITLANNSLESFVGTDPFGDTNRIRVFKAGSGDFTDSLIPASTLNPTSVNRYEIVGIKDGSTLPKWVQGDSTSKNLKLDISNFTIGPDLEFQKHKISGVSECIRVGQSDTAADGIIKGCVLH